MPITASPPRAREQHPQPRGSGLPRSWPEASSSLSSTSHFQLPTSNFELPTSNFEAGPYHSMLPVRARVFVALYLLSGSAALLYEVAWLRLLTLTMGHTTGAVGAVLAAFMGGLAIGAWVAGRFTDTLEPSRALRTYAALEVVVALCP